MTTAAALARTASSSLEPERRPRPKRRERKAWRPGWCWDGGGGWAGDTVAVLSRDCLRISRERRFCRASRSAWTSAMRANCSLVGGTSESRYAWWRFSERAESTGPCEARCAPRAGVGPGRLGRCREAGGGVEGGVRAGSMATARKARLTSGLSEELGASPGGLGARARSRRQEKRARDAAGEGRDGGAVVRVAQCGCTVAACLTSDAMPWPQSPSRGSCNHHWTGCALRARLPAAVSTSTCRPWREEERRRSPAHVHVHVRPSLAR